MNKLPRVARILLFLLLFWALLFSMVLICCGNLNESEQK
jgi:hypothetical protein